MVRIGIGPSAMELLSSSPRECDMFAFFTSVRIFQRYILLAWIVLTLLVWLALRCNVAVGQEGVWDWTGKHELYPGLQHIKLTVEQPRKMVIHGVRVDTQTMGMGFHTTERRRDWVEGKAETDRQTTRDFLRQSRKRGIPMVLAMNADAFSPWPVPYAESTPTDLSGLAIANGTVVSRGNRSPSLLKTKSGLWRIAVTQPDADLSEFEFAVSGFALCLDHGQPIPSDDSLHPRTGVGLTADARHLILVSIDGRQPASLGATTFELGKWLGHFGAHRGINMDGGGSTTLAWWNPRSSKEDGCELLNQPVGNGLRAERLAPEKFSPTERANGNNWGISLTLMP